MSAPSNNNQPKEVKDMSGYIAKNGNRTKDTQPHYRGKIRIKGKEYLLSIWERDGELMSVSVTDPEQLATKQGSSPQGSSQRTQGPAASSSQPLDTDSLFGDIFGA